MIFDDRACTLGEGPLWHPERAQLFWFDIQAKRLMTREGGKPRHWQFDHHVSAAGWVDHDTLLIASEVELFRFDLTTGARDHIAPLEADEPVTRSNDGRADPFGGFWIGTMGKELEPEAGAIYRFYKGQVEVLYQDITISNAICFAPDGRTAYYTDTPTGIVMRQALDGEGWPDGAAEPFLRVDHPDGAVVDAEGCLWIAQWGKGRVLRYGPEGNLISHIDLPASQVTCPDFGGTTLHVTSAAEGVEETDGGKTFAVDVGIQGQSEHRVIL
ncbi:SMP-30/gluconolactonase/LRE family protein [Aliiroseovarius sp.]|uniref:SMP-30/gluconolactonase/LRE family protein n=1 Tax=Aliiroseovarius sp. TaxID=1872442 RepID=UPI003BAB9649